MPAELKLCIDLIPQTCWGKNLRKQVTRTQWDNLRRQVYADQGNVCCVCGAGGELHCHEVFSYDEDRHVQKLTGFHAVCVLCHHVTHFGKAQLLAQEGELSLEEVIRHFLKVNGVTRKVFNAHKTAAFALWRERSKCEWQTDLGAWTHLVEQKTA